MKSRIRIRIQIYFVIFDRQVISHTKVKEIPRKQTLEKLYNNQYNVTLLTKKS